MKFLLLGFLLFTTGCVHNVDYQEPVAQQDSTIWILQKALDAGQKVNLAIVVVKTDVSGMNLYFDSPVKQELIRSLENDVTLRFERIMLYKLGKNPNFKIVDRYTLNEVLKQIKISMAISNDERIKLGQMLDANYLLLLDQFADYDHGGYRLNFRLIDVYSGRVLSVASIN